MSDKLEDDMDNTVDDVMKAIKIREDIEERGQTNEVVLAIFF